MTDTHDTDLNTEPTAEDGGLIPGLTAQLEATLWLPHDMDAATRATRLAAARAMLADIGPAAGIEGMLACQMVAAHEAAMACLGRSTEAAATPDQTDRNLRHAERLMALYSRQVEVLDRHRVREAERQERLERERQAAEELAFLDSGEPLPKSVIDSFMAFARDNPPGDDEDYEEVYYDFGEENDAGADDQGAHDQAADGGRRDPGPGDR